MGGGRVLRGGVHAQTRIPPRENREGAYPEAEGLTKRAFWELAYLRGMGRKTSNKARKDNPAKRRDWIIQIYPHFRDHGLRQLRMDKIAGLLGKSKSTVYEYFGSKEEIVAECLAYKMEALMGFEAILRDGAVGFEERYRRLLDYMVPVLSDISSLLMDDLKTLYPQLWEQVEVFYQHAGGVLEEYYQQGMEAGAFRAAHPRILALNDRFFFDTLLDPQFLNDTHVTAEEVFRTHFELKFKGLLQPKDKD